MASEKTQAEKFRKAAREAGCDTNEEAFEERLRRVASSPSRENGKLDDRVKPDRKKKKQ
jgi:hypothetical protein